MRVGGQAACRIPPRPKAAIPEEHGASLRDAPSAFGEGTTLFQNGGPRLGEPGPYGALRGFTPLRLADERPITPDRQAGRLFGRNVDDDFR
jgi:hypothetical protein